MGFCATDSRRLRRRPRSALSRPLRPVLLAASLAALSLAAAAGEGASPVRVEGLTDKALRASFLATLPARDAPQSLFEAERIAEEAATIAAAWLRAEGFYQGEAAAIADDDPPRATLKITTGPRFTFDEPAITFATARPPPAATAAVLKAVAAHVSAAAPARSEAVRAAETDAVAALRAAGFADAKAVPRRAVVDHARTAMALTFTFDLAAPAPVRLGGVTLDPPSALTPQALAAATPWRAGDRYSPEALADLRRALQASGAFSRVDIRLADVDDAAGLRPILVSVDRAPPRTLDLSASWSSSEGPGATAAWTYRNALKRGDTVGLGVTLAENEQQLRLSFSEPRGADVTRRAGLTLLREDAEPFRQTGAELGVSLDTLATARRGFSLGAALSASRFDAAAGVADATVLSGYVEARRNSADDRFDPTRGVILSARLEPAIAFGAAATGFVRGLAEARAYASPGAADDARRTRATLAGRLKLGWVAPVYGEARDLPLDRRFYAGGGGSVRGYGFRSIFPGADAARAIPPGGRGLIETSVETRLRVAQNWGLTAFVDGATVFDDEGSAPGMRFGAGIGVRYDLGFAPLRLDVAVPIDRRAQDAPAAVYLSLGQAF